MRVDGSFIRIKYHINPKNSFSHIQIRIFLVIASWCHGTSNDGINFFELSESLIIPPVNFFIGNNEGSRWEPKQSQ